VRRAQGIDGRSRLDSVSNWSALWTFLKEALRLLFLVASSSFFFVFPICFAVLPFDYVVIGTGSRYPSNIKPTESSLSFRRYQFKQERKRIAAASKVLVVGGGVVGTEMAGEVMSYFPDVPVELVTRSHCLLPRSRGAHDIARAVLQDPELPSPVAISYNETIDFAAVDHDTNTVPTSKGRELSLEGVRVVNCTGYTPNSDFLPRRWLDEKGFIKCTAQMEIEAKAVSRALRTSPGSRFYFAMGDVYVTFSFSLRGLFKTVASACA